MERKDFLKNSFGFLGAGGIIMAACKKTDTATTTSGSCIVSPTEVEGPYPYVGGEITNPLLRTDITDGQTGVPLTLALSVVDANNNCAIVSGARVDIWHCNKDGYYSGYANQSSVLGTKSYVGETWLRGYQTSDASGNLQFTTIYPGWYSGRATHIHFEVFINNVLKKIGQMAFPETVSDVVHVSTLYAAHGANTTRNASDSILGNSATDLANETLAMTGSLSTVYTGTYKIGLAL